MEFSKNADKGEHDLDEDDEVAGSRKGKSDRQDGTYVGRTFNDDALDVGETGAEARSEEGRD
jgi:hypothetical protein